MVANSLHTKRLLIVSIVVVLSYTGYRKNERPVLTPAEQVTVMKWSFAVQLFYHPLMGAIRASIIMFLYRVEDTRTFIRAALHTVFWINIGYMISTTLVNIFQCNPVHYAYMSPILDQPVNGKVEKHGKCINSLAFILASCALSIFMDLIIIPIPTVMVWNLQLRRRLKFAVVVIMSMGWMYGLPFLAPLLHANLRVVQLLPLLLVSSFTTTDFLLNKRIVHTTSD